MGCVRHDRLRLAHRRQLHGRQCKLFSKRLGGVPSRRVNMVVKALALDLGYQSSTGCRDGPAKA
jgi:hypothetical protein